MLLRFYSFVAINVLKTVSQIDYRFQYLIPLYDVPGTHCGFHVFSGQGHPDNLTLLS